MGKDWEVEGTRKKMEGKIQEFTAEMVGDDSERMKGKAKQAAGEVQQELGELGNKIRRETRDEYPR